MKTGFLRVCALWVCLAVLLLPLTVAAAGTPTFAVGTATAKPGETVTITVSTQNNPGIISFRLFVHYDTAALELVSAKQSAFSGIVFGPETKQPFVITWVDGVHPDNATNGVIATLTFRVREDAPTGNSPISVTYEKGDVFNAAMADVTFASAAGGVTIAGGAAPAAAVKHSVTESNGADRGLAFRFSVPAKGLTASANGTANLSKATVTYQGTACPLVRMGALLTTNSAAATADKLVLKGSGVTDVPVTRLCGLSADGGEYALRLVNIPEAAVARTVYARPYYVVRYQGKEVVVYGSVDATSYSACRV